MLKGANVNGAVREGQNVTLNRLSQGQPSLEAWSMEGPAEKQEATSAVASLSGRGDWIRTSDHLHPMQVRYRAALHPENSLSRIRADPHTVKTRTGYAVPLGARK